MHPGMCVITLHEIQPEDYSEIAMLIAADLQLQKEFGFPKDLIPTSAQLESDYKGWNKSHSAKMFCVRLSEAFIGLMTISRIDLNERSARLGYWLGSDYRHLGYGANAFDQALKICSQMGIRQISASIAADNLPSKKLWKNKGGKITSQNEGNYEYEMRLGSMIKKVTA